MRIFIILFLGLITACSTLPNSESMSVTEATVLPELPLLDDTFFGEPIEILTIPQIFDLTKEQKIDFLQKYKSLSYKSLTPNYRVHKYIQEHLENFNFHTKTLTASETLRRDQGNCLSLAILTKSLVDLTPVDISYELVETPPVYQSEGGMVLSSQHIRTKLADPDRGRSFERVSIFRGTITIDYFPTRDTRTLRMVEENEFYSMFYRNIAAEAMVDNNNNLAFWNLKKSLQLKPDDTHAINMMALLHSRLGYLDYAENLYRYGLQYGIENLEILNNYHTLLKQLNRTEDANKIASRLEKYEDPNPFKWIKLADSAYADKEYQTAIAYYKKASTMADYLHEPYAGIARSQYLLGNTRSARANMRIALEKSYQQETKTLYQTKFDLFSKLLSKD